MGTEGDVRLTLTRHELVTLREAIELLPNFKGRGAARDAVLAGVKTRKSSAEIAMPVQSADGLARQLVPTDLALVIVRAKLRRAIAAASAPPGREVQAASTG